MQAASMHLLGGAGEGEAADICGDHVGVVLWDSDVSGISVHQALVVNLNKHSTHADH